MAVRRYEELGEAVKQLLTERNMTLRSAEAKTGINYSTIYDMKEGKRPGAESLVRWAKAFRLDVRDWLKMAGYEDIADLLPDSEGETREPALEEYDDRVKRINLVTGRLRDEDKEKVLEYAEMLAEKNRGNDPRDQDYR